MAEINYMFKKRLSDYYLAIYLNFLYITRPSQEAAIKLSRDLLFITLANLILYVSSLLISPRRNPC